MEVTDRPIYRPAAARDIGLLWQGLAIAAYEGSVAAARAIPYVAAHLKAWPGPSDFGFIAESAEGEFLGAVWVRQFQPDEQTGYYAGDGVPEVSIGIKPEATGRGIGGGLMQRLVDEAEARGLDLCSNTRRTHPAYRMYRKFGFVPVKNSEFLNDSGEVSVGMYRRCGVSQTRTDPA